jgi:vacuolar protein sorting-associated protein 35
MLLLKLPSGSSSAAHGIKSTSLGGNYTDLLFMQPYSSRRQVAHSFISHALKAHVNQKFWINSVEGVNFFLGEVLSIVVRDQIDGGLFGSISANAELDSQVSIDWEDTSEEQTDLAKFIHIIQKTPNEHSFNLLKAARDHLVQVNKITKIRAATLESGLAWFH